MSLKTYMKPLPKEIKEIGRSIKLDADEQSFQNIVHRFVYVLDRMDLWDNTDDYFNRLRELQIIMVDYLKRRRKSTQPKRYKNTRPPHKKTESKNI